MYFIFIALYFSTPAIFYLYTKYIYKKYDKNISWCDNVVKIKKIYLVQIPLLIMWLINFYLFFSTSTLILNLFTATLACINLALFALWIITISPYKQTQLIHPIIGFFYILSYTFLAYVHATSFIKITLFYTALALALAVLINFFATKKLNTIQEEILIIVFTLYLITITI